LAAKEIIAGMHSGGRSFSDCREVTSLQGLNGIDGEFPGAAPQAATWRAFSPGRGAMRDVRSVEK